MAGLPTNLARYLSILGCIWHDIQSGTASMLIRYLIVGIIANAAYFTLYLFFYAMDVSVFNASILAYVPCLAITYMLNRDWTFEGRKALSIKYQGGVFGLVYASSALIMAAIISQLVKLGCEYRVAWVFGTSYAVIHNYIFSKYVIFRGE